MNNFVSHRALIWAMRFKNLLPCPIRQKIYSTSLETNENLALVANLKSLYMQINRGLTSSTSILNNLNELKPSTARLTDSLSSEQKDKLTQVSIQKTEKKDKTTSTLIAQTSTRKKFKLRVIIDEINSLEEDGFPLPTKLEEEHWQDLLQLEKETRTYYLDALSSGILTKQKKLELYKKDQELSGPLILPQKIVDEVLAEGDQAKINRINEIKYVYESLWQTGKKMYPYLEELELIGLLESDSRSAITKAFHYSLAKHNAKIIEYINKRIRQAKAPENIKQYQEEKEANKHIYYGLGGNTIHYRIHRAALESPNKNKTIREFNEWGQPLVLDLSLVKHMSFQQVKSLFYRELAFAVKSNEASPEPFAIYLTSYDPNCDKCSILTKAIKNIMDDDSTVVVTEKSYLEVFPQQRLLYLSPDSKNDLMKHDPNNIYVIGALIDTSEGHAPYTLSQAKKQNIRHARLPMKRFLGISRELNVDHCVAIMSDFKFTNDWFYSFRWVPARLFKNRLKSPHGYTPEMEAVFIAHRALSPMGCYSSERGESNESKSHYLINMRPREYRRKYKELMEKCLENVDTSKVIDSSKYQWQGKKSYNEWKFGNIV